MPIQHAGMANIKKNEASGQEPVEGKKFEGEGQSATRSGDYPIPPFYTPSGPNDNGPTLQEIMHTLGLSVQRALTPEEVRLLLKGEDQLFRLIGEKIVALYRDDAADLKLKNLTPDLFAKMYQRVAYLTPREETAAELATRANHQKLVSVSDFLDAVLRVRRRVEAHGEDDAELLARWEPVLAVLRARFPGRTTSAATEPAQPPQQSNQQDVAAAGGEEEEATQEPAPTKQPRARSAPPRKPTSKKPRSSGRKRRR